MGDYFFQLLPASHAIRSMNLAAARTSLSNEPTFATAVGTTANEARLQCAAISWVMGASYSLDTVKTLPSAARTYLIQIFGLAVQPRSPASQAARIDAHRSTHHPELIVPPVGAGGNLHGAGPTAGAAGASSVAGAAGAPAAPPGDDTGGFAAALLPAPQVAALLCIPRGELQKLLDAAGVPCGAATANADMRIKCAAAAWAAEKLRSADEFNALPDGIRDRILNAFEVPAAWRPEARQQAVLTLLHACRRTPWALDPSLSLGLVNRERSDLFRLGEQFAAESRGSGATPSQLLSPQEYAELLASIAPAGYSEKDLVLSHGRWTLDPSRTPQCASAGAATTSHATAAKIEAELRTLYVQPNSLLTAAERKDQATRSKTTPTKRSAAFPGDAETETADPGLHPFAEWPWEQHFRVAPDLPYKRAGRILKNGLRWCNTDSTCPLMNMTYDTRSTAADSLYEQFSTAVSTGAHDRALLVAQLALAEATEQMKAVLANAQLRASSYPTSKMLVHIAERRSAQSTELKTFLADINTRITEASNAPGASATCATASWIDFLTGWLSKVDKDLVEQESLDQAARSAQPQATPSSTVQPTPLSGNKNGRAASAGGGSGKGGGSSSGGGSGRGGSGSTPTAGAAGPPAKKMWQVCKFRQHIMCSPDVIGDALGVAGAPSCLKCHNGNHYHGECPKLWGSAGITLPGFTADGQRAAGEWHKTENEPLRKVVKAWIAFFKDHTNFQNQAPVPAGVTGAPDLAAFEARELVAPRKP